ncbi:MAG: DUF4136 domain-containing protein [Piscinibacter sp.]|uniref:DUF4136 domain-containing protein n=1 Tax=Piscinibacter TaxID=1114981 RepID=UPI000FDECFF4|nr:MULTISPECIES: DUF4136 domain-containing protein [Piscinibacter]MCW5667635.1 DUF4136 domain-containing protein [Piscinibacter sp.]
MSRTLSFLLAAGLALLLAGCASLNQLTSEVSSFSQWPADRKPGSYTFERLPSQQARPDQQQLLEDSARRALELAGFTPAADARSAEYVVQLGARVDATDQYLYYDDPFWWRGGLYYSRWGRPYWRPGPGFGFGFATATTNYEREVALLIRDRQSAQPLFEARAVNDGSSPAIRSLLPAMFEAALKDFPTGGVNPRRVTTPIDPNKPSS